LLVKEGNLAMAEGRLVIVKTGSAPQAVRDLHGDFEDWIALGTGFERPEVDVIDVQAGAPLPQLTQETGVVVTGSSAFVSEREPWSVRTGEWLAAAVRLGAPILGICYGHQLLAQALGGRVGRNPRGREIGTVRVDLGAAGRAKDPLLGGVPEFVDVHASHVESVLALPDRAVLLGSNAADDHHAFAVGPRAWGVQFHPEFAADVMRGYLSERAGVLREEGIDAERLTREVRDTPHGSALLGRFGEIVRGG
jgi:GMP synthase (glutamine-hydrolysing)